MYCKTLTGRFRVLIVTSGPLEEEAMRAEARFPILALDPLGLIGSGSLLICCRPLTWLLRGPTMPMCRLFSRVCTMVVSQPFDTRTSLLRIMMYSPEAAATLRPQLERIAGG